MRDELLIGETFYTTRAARLVNTARKRECDRLGPYSLLDCQPRAP